MLLVRPSLVCPGPEPGADFICVVALYFAFAVGGVTVGLGSSLLRLCFARLDWISVIFFAYEFFAPLN